MKGVGSQKFTMSISNTPTSKMRKKLTKDKYLGVKNLSMKNIIVRSSRQSKVRLLTALIRISPPPPPPNQS